METDSFTADLDVLGFDDPHSKYFNFMIETDGKSFIAKATCKAKLKDNKGKLLKGLSLTLDQEKKHGGDLALRKMARW